MGGFQIPKVPNTPFYIQYEFGGFEQAQPFRGF